MQSDKVLTALKELAEKLGVAVAEQVFKSPGINVRSGLCKVKGTNRYILDRKLSVHDKVELLADCLGEMDTSGVFVIPHIRELLARRAKNAEAVQEIPEEAVQESAPEEPASEDMEDGG